MENLYQYIDDLLRFQSKAVEQYNHKGVLGDAREEFIHSEIRKRVDDLKGRLHKGEVYFEGEELGQHDIILRKKGTDNPIIGGQVRINAKSCAAIIEVKTNEKLLEIKNFEKKAKQFKKISPNLICGMFCYKISGKTCTVLERSGFKFDREYQVFESDLTKKIYENIDFILCLNDEEETNGISRNKEPIRYSKGFFLKKEDTTYQLYQSPPFSEWLFQEIRRAEYLNS